MSPTKRNRPARPKFKCPQCQRWVASTKNVYFRRHRASKSNRYHSCPGSGTACAGDPMPPTGGK